MALPSIDDIKALAGGAKRETDEYEVRGVVTKIDGDTVFVRFEGSDIETPVDASCANVKVGDEVSVHVSHDDTHIVGNRTDPSATTSQMDQVNSRVSIIDSIIEVVESAVSVVSSSISVINSRIRVRDNILEFLDELGGVVASFGERIRLGNADESHVELDADRLDFSVGESTVASFGAGTVELGNDSTTAEIFLAGKKSKIRGRIKEGDNIGVDMYTAPSASELYPNQQASVQLRVPTASGKRGWAILQYSDTSNTSNPYNSGVSASSDGVYLYGKDGVFVTSNWGNPTVNKSRVLTVNEFTETVTTILDNVTTAAGGAQSGTASTVKPTGGTWYPLCVSGWYAGSRYELLSRCRLNSKGNNSCTINYAVQNTSSASRALSMDVHVLWARVY